MKLRDYAENLKQALGTSLGFYEIVKDQPQPVQAATDLLNALPAAALATFPSFFVNTPTIASFIVSAGPQLEVLAGPVAGVQFP